MRGTTTAAVRRPRAGAARACEKREARLPAPPPRARAWRSVGMSTDSTAPTWPKRGRSWSAVVLKGRLPTYTFAIARAAACACLLEPRRRRPALLARFWELPDSLVNGGFKNSS